MPRNGSGVAERPPNTNAVAGQTIESADFEDSMNDIYSMLNSTVPTAYLPTLSDYGGVAKSGDTMTGFLTLSANATANLHAVTKQQMDVAIATRAATSHTQAASTITDFSTAADLRIAAASINALADVAITSAASGHVLYNDGTNWVNRAPYTDYDKGAFAASTIYTQAHGLAAYPTAVDVYLECTTIDRGYAVGDRILATSGLDSNVGTAKITNSVNTTTVRVSVGADSLTLNHATTGASDNAVNSSWKIIIRVFA